MKIRIYTYITVMALMVPSLSASAQKKARNVRKAAKTETVDPRIERMISATQDIMFIDSIVVDKDGFVGRYTLNSESGRIYRYNDFFNDRKISDSYVHINEMGNKCYYSQGDSADNMKLYTSDLLDNAWTKASELSGIVDGEKITAANYPFIMADGTTLYFAAKGKESIGGYDIFVTRFDIESGQFLKPENIGMPFNSTANDYMYAVDELDSIGWFVTDRNQPDGKVCIYTFIPSDSRQTYTADEYTTEQIKDFARISRIANTWKDGSERKKALSRLQNIVTNRNRRSRSGDFAFVINDNTTYRSLSDFRSQENVNRYSELTSIRKKLDTLGKAIEKARNYYATAAIHERNELKGEILKSEQQMEALEIKARSIEKAIRNSENNLLK
ncbi:MAG: hypothetical protein Q4C43_02230 [Prevotella sp.]|nr:hypothetical protein [Prevotella sp.]